MPFGENLGKGKVEILSTHNIICGKFASVCRKIATFLTHDAAGTSRIIQIQFTIFIITIRPSTRAAVGMGIPMGIPMGMVWYGYGDCDESPWVLWVICGDF